MTEFGIPLIETVGLTKKFGELEVLKGISERIYKGEVVSVIGPSGGGKSTFLRCLNLLETPTSGKVLFEGAEGGLRWAKDSLRYFSNTGRSF